VNPDPLSRSTVEELRAALLVGLQCGDFSPLEFAPEPSVGLQLRELFIDAAAQAQEKLKRAVVRAMVEWRPRAHREATLVALSYIALDIGASDAISVITDWVRREEKTIQPAPHALRLVAVLAGFAPMPEARRALEGLQATRLGEAAGAIVLNGLCKCEPTEFPKYLTWFLELSNALSGAFHVGCVMSELIRIVGLPHINAGMGALAPRHFALFLQLAQEQVIPRLSFISTGRQRMILCEQDRIFDMAVEAELSHAGASALPAQNALIAAAAHSRQLARSGITSHLRALADLCGESEAAA
jgi:hypothetical protein